MTKSTISNWPFTTKFAVPSAISLAMICVVALVSYFTLSAQVRLTKNIVETDFKNALTLVQANNNVQMINGRLYKTLTSQAAQSIDSSKAATDVGALAGEIELVVKELNAYRDTMASKDEIAAVQTIIDDLAVYEETIGVVASMMEIDFASAVAFAEPFAENYQALEQKFKALVAEAVSSSERSAADSKSSADRATLILFAVTVIAIFAAAAVAMAVGRSTVRSIHQIADATHRLASGDHDVDVTSLNRRDELHSLVESLETFKSNSIERDRLAEREREAILAREKRAERIEALITSFETESREMLDLVASASSQLRSTAEKMQGTAGQTTSQSGNASHSVQQAANDVRSVAAASEELSVSILEIAGSVEESVKAITKASDSAGFANSTMSELTKAASQINEVVGLINDIAEQTNLLALNATIEAARAGEAGKGFAVVATEVKTLANQTSQATNRVAASVADIQRVSDTVAEAMNAISDAISIVNAIASKISSSMQQQGGATQEIAASIARVSGETDNVSVSMENVKVSAIDTGRSAGEVLEAASSLQMQAEQMKRNVTQFLDGIRAA